MIHPYILSFVAYMYLLKLREELVEKNTLPTVKHGGRSFML